MFQRHIQSQVAINQRSLRVSVQCSWQKHWIKMIKIIKMNEKQKIMASWKNYGENLMSMKRKMKSVKTTHKTYHSIHRTNVTLWNLLVNQHHYHVCQIQVAKDFSTSVINVSHFTSLNRSQTSPALCTHSLLLWNVHFWFIRSMISCIVQILISFWNPINKLMNAISCQSLHQIDPHLF